MKQVLTDLGDTIDGWAAEVDGSMVCVATPRILSDAAVRQRMRNLVTAAGGNCATCRGCLIGREVA
jgi:hypothetical protein